MDPAKAPVEGVTPGGVGVTTTPVVTATPASGGVGTPAAAQQVTTTPAQAPTDAEIALAEAKAKFEKDIAGVKSSLQSQMAILQREGTLRESEYQKRIRELETAGMDGEERKEYERIRLAEDHQRALEELQQLREQSSLQQQAQADAQWFMDRGVDPKKLDFSSLNALRTSGWKEIDNELTALRSGKVPGSIAAVPRDPTAPKIVTTTGVVPPEPTWDDLVKKYGNEEAVYQLVQDGKLRPSIIPLSGA